MLNDTRKLIKDFSSDVVTRAGMRCKKVVLVDGSKIGCLDTHLMKLEFENYFMSLLVFNSDIVSLESEGHCARLEAQIKLSLKRINSSFQQL